jgi:hypothetical protein
MISISWLMYVFSVGGMVFMVVGGLGLILAQWLLPSAREAIKRMPPTGPGWARTLWFAPERFYGSVLTIAALAGLIAAVMAGISFRP